MAYTGEINIQVVTTEFTSQSDTSCQRHEVDKVSRLKTIVFRKALCVFSRKCIAPSQKCLCALGKQMKPIKSNTLTK